MDFLLLTAGVLGTIILIYLVLGLLVEVIVTRLPAHSEKTLGGFYSQFLGEGSPSKKQTYLQQIVDELTEVMPNSDRRFKVHVVKNKEPNAIALPGGNIVVFTPLIEEAESKEELTFVLAHELGHYANKDHLRGFGRLLVLVTVATALSGGQGAFPDFLVNSLVNVEMKFSQQQERNADRFALEMLHERYQHVAGALDFLKRMASAENKGRMWYFFASHPYPQDRISTLEQQIFTNRYETGQATRLPDDL